MRWLLLFLFFHPAQAANRPDHIRFGRLNYPVYYVKQIEGAHEWDGMTYCKSVMPRVLIMKTLNHEDMAETLMHEAIHVATDCGDGATTTHQAIYRLAPIINQLLVENPDLLKFIANK